MDDFKGVLQRFSRKFSMRRRSSANTTKDDNVSKGSKPCKLSRSHSARLPSDRVPPIKKMATVHQSDFEAYFQQAIYAIQAGQSSTLRRILQLNKLSTEFNMNAYDKYGRTIASHFAAKCPRKSLNAMIEVLVEESIDLDLGTRRDGLTPLMLAAQTENCDVAIHALLTHGADPNIVDYNGESVLHWLESSNSERDCDLFETRSNEARKQLLVFGAKTAIKNSRGKTARDIVTQRARGYRVMKAMSDEGIDLNSVNSEEISSINSPFGNDCGVDDDMESFSDEIATDFRSRKVGYRELDYYMEKIVEIQEQMAS